MLAQLAAVEKILLHNFFLPFRVISREVSLLHVNITRKSPAHRPLIYGRRRRVVAWTRLLHRLGMIGARFSAYGTWAEGETWQTISNDTETCRHIE